MSVNNPPLSIDMEVLEAAIEAEVEEALEGYEPEEVNYSEVVTYADLPDAAEFTNETFIVLTGTGIFGINRKRAGLWRSNGEAWYRLGALEGSGGVIYSTPTTGMTILRGVVYDEPNKEIVYKT